MSSEPVLLVGHGLSDVPAGSLCRIEGEPTMLIDALPLRRPLAFLDLETTGISVERDRIIELALLVVHPDGREDENVFRVNPGMPIPPDASRIHGISDRDVTGRPPFAAFAPTIAVLLTGCDLAGFNIVSYDLPLLENEFRRCGLVWQRSDRSLIDVMRLFHRKERLERRDLAAAVRFYCGRDHIGAHSALADARATAEVLRRQLERYRELPREIAALEAYCCGDQSTQFVEPSGRLKRRGGVVVLGFGKHFGVPLATVAREEPEYLRWMLSADFSEAVKAEVRAALDRHGPRRHSSPPRGSY